MLKPKKIQFRTLPSHNGLEVDPCFLTERSIEYKKAFALMLIIKKKYVDSRVHNYSVKKLAETFNLSEYTTKKYINRLLNEGFCHFEGKDLQFISLDKIMQNRGRGGVIQFAENNTIDTTIENINILIIKNNFKSQEKLRQVKSDLSKASKEGVYVDPKSYKKSKKIADMLNLKPDVDFTDINYIGMRKLSKLLGSSLDYTAKFILKLAKQGKIKIKRLVTKLVDGDFSMLTSEAIKNAVGEKCGYIYSHNKMTFLYLGTEILFI